MEVGETEREIIYLSLHCHDQNDSCIKMGSYESHFNVSLTVQDKVTRHKPPTTTSEEERRAKRIGTKVPLLTNLLRYCHKTRYLCVAWQGTAGRYAFVL